MTITLHHHVATAETLPGARAMDSGSSNSTGSSTDAATISSNDFLTLLVTEMQNQDPTADTDPNEYINQLVNVNSLEQLISINQTLSSTLDPSATGDAAGGGAGAMQAAASSSSSLATESRAATESPAAAESPAVSHTVEGNLGVPAANASAQRIAGSLGGQSAAVSHSHPRS